MCVEPYKATTHGLGYSLAQQISDDSAAAAAAALVKPVAAAAAWEALLAAVAVVAVVAVAAVVAAPTIGSCSPVVEVSEQLASEGRRCGAIAHTVDL